MNASETNVILHSENLVNYDPTDVTAFQWVIEESFLPNLIKIMKGHETTVGHLVLNGQPEPIVGYIRPINEVMHFQLKLNAQVAESVIPKVPENVRRRMLEQT